MDQGRSHEGTYGLQGKGKYMFSDTWACNNIHHVSKANLQKGPSNKVKFQTYIIQTTVNKSPLPLANTSDSDTVTEMDQHCNGLASGPQPF